MPQGNGVHSRGSAGLSRGDTSSYAGAPPDGSLPGRLLDRKLTREECAAFWRRGLVEGWKTARDVLRALHETGAPPDRIAAGLRAVGWPDGRTEWPR